MLLHHAHCAFADFSRKLVRLVHSSTLKSWSLHQIRGGSLEHWTKRISDPNTSVLVAVSAGNLVGFSVLRHLSVHGDIQVEIETLYVLPSHWRLGVGSELLQASRDCARERTGCMSVWLAVNAKNTRALQFYRDRGSSAVGKTDFVLDGERHENIVLTFRAE